MSELFIPRGTHAVDGFDLAATPAIAGWPYSGLLIKSLAPGETLQLATADREMAVLPLSGSFGVQAGSSSFDLRGRTGVFDAVTDWAYVGIDTDLSITTASGGEVALCTAQATRSIDPYMVAAEDVQIEVRGGGRGTRQINNFLSADQHDADKLIAVEVLTPDGGWSSYPPHKHDEFSDDEVELEEIYYFKIEGDKGIGMFSLYTSDHEINETWTVRDGDTVLVPKGFHGPAAATPGHHMYYLNVMAGPSEPRAWRFCDDPDHTWARGMLDAQEPDPRLPLTTAAGRT
ncbi:MAG: 5-deoxy-glucuronate isomerase [Acidimicrobiia bacterium]|nr:5-deoxy-glucuronate isomerase [Acidimicrobiia bacterium]